MKISQIRFHLRIIPVVGVLVVGCASCAPPDASVESQSAVQSSVAGAAKLAPGPDGPSFPTVSVLKKESTVVIVGEVGEVIGRELNDPDKSSKFATSVVINEVKVIQSIKGSLTAGQNINVLYWDQKQIPREGTSAIETGQKLLLFLKFYPSGAPGIETVSNYYYPRGQDQGIFDVKESLAVARSEVVRSVDGEAPSYVDNHLSIRVTDVADAPEKSRTTASGTTNPSGGK